jgi:8-oxo-dGTP pyrophosphatase MutT (NUDIX family)
MRLFDAAYRVALICAYRLAYLYWMLRRPTLHGVYVALWHGENVLLIWNSYKRFGSFPGGGIGRRENARAAARRELFEEAGVAIAESELREVAEYTHFIAWHTEHARFFEVRLQGEPALAIDRREVIAARFATRAEALALPLTPLVRRYLSERER